MAKTDWIICRSLTEFQEAVKERGIPEFVGYDSDLGDKEKGAQCADWLWDWCGRHGYDFPRWGVHSSGPDAVALKGKLLREFSGQYFPDGYER